jgi:energy-coupling factor transport system permease protein
VGRGAFFVARISLLVLGTSLVTLTTSPVALTDALSQLMRPLRHVGVPVDDVAMMFSIALRFIPTTAEEADRIVTAQSARGARFDEGGPIRRAKAWLPVLVPLFVNLFRRADNLAWRWSRAATPAWAALGCTTAACAPRTGPCSCSA